MSTIHTSPERGDPPNMTKASRLAGEEPIILAEEVSTASPLGSRPRPLPPPVRPANEPFRPASPRAFDWRPLGREFDFKKHGRLAAGAYCVAAGITSGLLGVLIGLWARAHSPHMGFGEMLSKAARDPEFIILKEPVYYLVLMVATGLGLLAVVLLPLGAFLLSTVVARNSAQ